METEKDLQEVFNQAIIDNLPDVVEVVASIIDQVNVNAKIAHRNAYPVHICVENNNCSLLELLILHGAMVNSKNEFGYTSLHIACLYNHVELVDKLLESGAVAINATSKRKITSLMIAAWQGHTKIIKLLIPYGCSLNQTSDDGFMAIHYSACNNNIDSLRCILKASSATYRTKQQLLWEDVAQILNQANLLEINKDFIANEQKLTNKTIHIEEHLDSMPIITVSDDMSATNNTITIGTIAASPTVTAPNAIVDTPFIASQDKTTEQEKGETFINHAITQENEIMTHNDNSHTQPADAHNDDTNNDVESTQENASVTQENFVDNDHTQPADAHDDTLNSTQENTATKENFGGITGTHYSFDKQDLADNIASHTVASNNNQQDNNQQDNNVEEDNYPHQQTETDSQFDTHKGKFRSINNQYTDRVSELVVCNILASLKISYEYNRTMQGTVTPGEQTPKLSFFDRNGNVIVWEILDYDPFDSNNVDKWNETKIWYQNNGFNYDINFFMSYFNNASLDSVEIQQIAKAIQHQI